VRKKPTNTTDRATILTESAIREGSAAPRMVVVSGPLLGYVLTLNKDAPIVIGRLPDCDMALPHPSVSRAHCRIWAINEQYWIEDLSSTNKTYVNGHAIEQKTALHDGDQIGVGNNALKYFSGASMEARYHDELIELAIYDNLTGMYNRRRFRALLDEEIERAKKDSKPLTLIIIDLDHFKRINDQYGHLIGDQALSSVSAVVKERATATIVPGRLGGEEFAVMMIDAELSDGLMLAEVLRTAIAQKPIEAKGQHLQFTASFGVATLNATLMDSAKLLSAADAALYAAKNSGRNCVRSATNTGEFRAIKK
jgi:diguanylate cyclase (GGDEF)-like protein